MHLLKVPKLRGGPGDAFVLDLAVKPEQTVEKGQKLAILQTAGEIVEVESPISGAIASLSIYPGKIVAACENLLSIGSQQEKAQATQKESKGQQKDTKMAENNQKLTTGEVTPILMPQAGQSMEEGTIISWQAKEGDQIEVGQVICEIETDKATMEVEATHGGRVAKIIAKEGDIIEVKKPIAFLAENDEDVEAYLGVQTGETDEHQTADTEKVAEQTPSTQQTAPPQVSQQAAVGEGGRVKASPAAKKLAEQRGIDISAISTGSGPGGRIISEDVEKAKVGASTPTPAGQAVRHDLTKMRRAIAQNLLWSKQNVPHFYTKITVEAKSMFALYRKTKQQFKCTVNDFVTRACAIVVAEMPAFRSQYQGDHILQQPQANIGIAVGTENGLTVPVVLSADKLSFQELASRSRQVVESARDGKLEGVGQGVFTISNLGMFGVEEFSAIINPPESAILSVGAIREDIVVKDGAIRPTQVMTMVLSADHRIIDGTAAGNFSVRIKELLEQPEQLL